MNHSNLNTLVKLNKGRWNFTIREKKWMPLQRCAKVEKKAFTNVHRRTKKVSSHAPCHGSDETLDNCLWNLSLALKTHSQFLKSLGWPLALAETAICKPNWSASRDIVLWLTLIRRATADWDSPAFSSNGDFSCGSVHTWHVDFAWKNVWTNVNVLKQNGF